MKRKAVLGIMLTLLLFVTTTLALDIQTANAELTTIVVPDDYSTIQEAIDSAKPGDFIYVRSGTYFEKQVTINKPLTLIGENTSTTAIDGDGTWVCVYIQSTNNVNVSGFTIQNGYGIYLYCSENIVISGNMISTNGQGITLLESTSNSISGNNITNNVQGISLSNSSDNFIGENNIMNSLLHGIGLEFSDGNYLVHNNIRNTYYWGIEMHLSDDNIITGNKLVDTINGSSMLVGDSRINKIYHNNFINNSISQAFTYSSYRTAWDDNYPSGGNYWSDYIAKGGYDADGDGVGDIPYVIDDYNQDNYPLMELWAAPTMIKTLIRTVRFWNLHQGTENSLTFKLERTLHLLDVGNKNGAIHKLMGFMKQVEALRETKLTIEQADYLTAEVQRIIDLVQG